MKMNINDEKHRCEYCFKFLEAGEIFAVGCESDGMIAYACKSCYDKYFKDYPDSFCMEIK